MTLSFYCCCFELRKTVSMKYLVFTWLFISCQSTSKSSVSQDSIRASVSNNFRISIPSSIGTGYSWQFLDTVNNRFVSLISSTYEKSTKDVDGEEGADIFLFKPLQKGSTELHFRYSRSWEKNPAKTKEKTFHVEIE